MVVAFGLRGDLRREFKPIFESYEQQLTQLNELKSKIAEMDDEIHDLKRKHRKVSNLIDNYPSDEYDSHLDDEAYDDLYGRHN